MLRTLKIKLHPSEVQHTILLATMERFNEACNWIAGEAFGGRVTNKIAIQKIVYYAVRERFGLSAQMVVRAIAKVAEAYKRDRNILPTFRPHGAVVYDERILSFEGLEFASIWTLQGRISVAMKLCGYHSGIIGNSHVRGQADLCLIKGNGNGNGKGKGKGKGNNRSLRPSGFTPAFGRAVAPSARSFLAGLKPCPSGFEVWQLRWKAHVRKRDMGHPDLCGVPELVVHLVWGYRGVYRGAFHGRCGA